MKCIETRWVSGYLCDVCGTLITEGLTHFAPGWNVEDKTHHADCCGKLPADPRAAEYMAASDSLPVVKDTENTLDTGAQPGVCL